MLDPRTIMVAIPCGDGRLMSETAGNLLACGGLYATVSMPSECSHVSLVRNLIAGQFLASPFEWLVCIDSDIAFTRRDFEWLLEPCDLSARYGDQVMEDLHSGTAVTDKCWGRSFAPTPTRVVTAQCADARNLDSKTAAAADLLVCAEYCFKNDTLEPVKLGMGFVRIHRSVFERLQGLVHDGGPTIEVRRDLFEQLKSIRFDEDGENLIDALIKTAEDKAGQPRLWQASHKGRLYHDYFPSGPILSQFVPTAEWKGEDHGFFTLCMLAGIIPRIETRTRLTHIGRKAYHYLGPEVGGGQ